MSARPPEELIARHEAFLERGPAGHPLLGFWLGGYYPAEQFPRGAAAWRNGQLLSPDDVTFNDGFRVDYERLFALHRDVDDDFFYVGSAYWGIPWMEAVLGCPVFAGPETAWAKAFLSSPPDITRLPEDLDHNPWFQCLRTFTRELISLAANRFPVCPPLLRGPGDLASAMLGGMEFALGFTDCPEAMRALLDHCATMRLNVVRRLQAMIPAWHGAYAAGGYPSKVWSKRPVAYNQEDSAALLSPGLFTEFLLPCERRQCQAAKVNFIHLHSACLYPVDILLNESCYNVLEINVDHAGVAPLLTSLLPVLQKIQKAGRPLLLWGRFSQEDLRLFRGKLSPTGLSIQPIVDNIEQAHAFWQALGLKPWRN